MHVTKQDNKDNNLLIQISHLNDELTMKNKNEDAQCKIIIFKNSKFKKFTFEKYNQTICQQSMRNGWLQKLHYYFKKHFFLEIRT